MNAILILMLILFILMSLLGGKTGVVSFFTLFLNFIILFLTLLFIVFGAPIYIMCFVFSLLIAAVNLFLLNGVNIKTVAAFIASIFTTLLMLAAIYFSVQTGHLQGFTPEEQDETYVYSLNIGINMTQFMIFTVILAVIAAVIDLAITISSPMFELHVTNPALTRKQLFVSGMRVGREILATSANTIYLAFLGGSLTLLFWFFNLDYRLGHLINTKLFTQEIITIALGGIAIAICIPITAFMTATLLTRPKK
ncbi:MULTISPECIES: YibE/F family protein [unclassified Staphylococcus]|uniref:YibE/F family protein n=1 Tax=unclassified Staphylococcus TaxID=91994 RepID=UPI0021CF2BE5|nr:MULTISPECIES: YibE/F family protein [unclassified Staphylococcus]UXR78259.1 YibE/F family protein [Staphylococcus sp. IVB6227]UXR82423.1 YibE/F family protein [Staphylococcus sp. IVB6214]